jgi:hypothetical protein
MIPKRETLQVVEDRNLVKEAKYVSFVWQILRGMVLIVAIYCFIVVLAGFQYGWKWEGAAVVFVLSSFALIWMIPKPETLPAVEGEGAATERQRRLPDWSLVSYWVITGLGFNWVCAFLWFSRRYAFFSASVIGAMGLILALYAAIALLVFCFTVSNWRTTLMVFLLELYFVPVVVLRLRLLR